MKNRSELVMFKTLLVEGTTCVRTLCGLLETEGKKKVNIARTQSEKKTQRQMEPIHISTVFLSSWYTANLHSSVLSVGRHSHDTEFQPKQGE